MDNVMLDLETMGNGSSAAITAIGAVKFDSERGIYNSFYEIVDLQSSIDAGLEMEADTVLWWLKQDDNARKEFAREGIDLIDSLDRFAGWVNKDSLVWGNGAAFDNAILSTAYRKCEIGQPWEWRNNRCYRTVKKMRPDIKAQRFGVHHRAVDDAESQALHLLAIYDAIGMML